MPGREYSAVLSTDTDTDTGKSVEAAIARAIAAVNVVMGPTNERRFAPIGEAKPGESVTVTGRDYEEMAECVTSELARCGYLSPSFDPTVVVARIMQARRMTLNSRWQTYEPQAIPAHIFETLLKGGMLAEQVVATV
jgi:hypothetical protein